MKFLISGFYRIECFIVLVDNWLVIYLGKKQGLYIVIFCYCYMIKVISSEYGININY